MTALHVFLQLVLLQTVTGITEALSHLKKNYDLSDGANATLKARLQRASFKDWQKEPYCINKESDCRCPISPAYKESPAPRCHGSNTFDGCGRRVCYYNNEAHMRTKSETTGQPDMPYYVFQAPGCLCTHLVYGFALVDSDLTASSINLLWPYSTDVPCNRPCKGLKQEPNLDHPGMVNCIKYAKKTNPSLKTLLGIGGKQQSNKHFSFMLHSPETRRIFIEDVKKTLEVYNFQGIDINWPFPGFHCNDMGKDTECRLNQMDKYRFTSFLKELRQAVPPELSVTATVSCSPDLIQSAYEPHKIIYHVDWLNLMTFDLHNRHDHQANHPSRLNPKFDGDKENVKWCVNHWINSAWKANPSSSRNQIRRKLVLGLNLYASIYQLSKPNDKLMQENSTERPQNTSSSPEQVKKNTKEGNTTSGTEPPKNDSLSFAQVKNITEKGDMISKRETAQNATLRHLKSKLNAILLRQDKKEPAQNASLGPAHVYSQTIGYISSYELCAYRKSNFLVDSRLNELEGGYSGKEPIAENIWNFIAYEDAQSLREKITYATDVENLGGVMIWDIAADDFRGTFCNQGSHPLLHSITDNCMYQMLTPKPEVVVSRDPLCGDKRKAPSGTGYEQLEHGRWIPMPCAKGTAFSVITCVCDWPQGSSAPPARQQPPMSMSETASKAGLAVTVSGLRAATTLALALMAATLPPC